MEGTLAEIRLFAGNFAPLYWMECEGQLLSIAENTALFSLLGTTYGGDGQVTFALPDFRGRVPVGTGNGQGLSPIDLGEMSGSNIITLLNTNLPAHTHALNASSGAGNSTSPSANVLAVSTVNEYGATPPNQSLAQGSIGVTGNSSPVSVKNPYLGLIYVICTEGIYPSRS
jgi:microcystin-dependent protein